MHNTDGFILINFCVYLMLFSMVTALVTTLMFRTYALYKTRIALHANIEDAYCAQDIWMYDMRYAPTALHDWNHREAKKIGWACKNSDSVQWYFEDNKLMRLGIQDKKRHYNIAVRGVSDGEFVVHTKGDRMYMISLRMKVRGIKEKTELETAYGFYGIS